MRRTVGVILLGFALPASAASSAKLSSRTKRACTSTSSSGYRKPAVGLCGRLIGGDPRRGRETLA